jgi:hypothetical protein
MAVEHRKRGIRQGEGEDTGDYRSHNPHGRRGNGDGRGTMGSNVERKREERGKEARRRGEARVGVVVVRAGGDVELALRRIESTVVGRDSTGGGRS